MRAVVLMLAAAVLTMGLSACSQEAQEQIQSAVETAAPTIQAAVETAAPTIQAAAQQAATQVVGAVETAQPTIQAVQTSVVGALQTAQPTLEAAAGEIVTAVALAANTWQWTTGTTVDQTEMVPEDPTMYTVDFKADGTVAIKADCNQAAGSFEIEGDMLTISVGPMTLAACGEESLGEDFVALLGQVESFAIDEDGTLTLTLADDAGTLQFAPAEDM